MTALEAARVAVQPVGTRHASLRIGLLGFGQVGSAFASIARDAAAGLGAPVISAALVRDAHRPRGGPAVALTASPADVLGSDPDVIVEVLGGREPARTLLLAAIDRGLAVVTANKSVLAAHGDELLEAAAAAGVPFRYEASVMAGVPFLGTFAARPLAADVSAVTAVLNGTSNFILTAIAGGGGTFDRALAEAQRLGYAEPDPSNDIAGTDAAEKLCVLLRHFGGWRVAPADLETEPIAGVEAADLEHAALFGGAIKPVAAAEWNGDRLAAFVGPAFVPSTDPLSAVRGVQNAISIRTRWNGVLTFAGGGAGPRITAATLFDDVIEAARGPRPGGRPRAVTPRCAAAETGWFVRLSGPRLPGDRDIASLLAAHGVWLRRLSPRDTRSTEVRQWLLAYEESRPRIERALAALRRASGCSTAAFRALEPTEP